MDKEISAWLFPIADEGAITESFTQESIDISTLPIFEDLGTNTRSPQFSGNVITDETFNDKMNDFDEARVGMLLYDKDPLFDKFMAGDNEIDQASPSDQSSIDSPITVYDQQEIVVESTVTIGEAAQQVEQKSISKSSSLIDTFNVINTDNNPLTQITQAMTIAVPPCPYQRVRYEDECAKTLRYIVVPYDGTMTIAIPDLRGDLPAGVTTYMRITRAFVKDDLLLLHPYPIWMKNDLVKVHNHSLFLPVLDEDMAHQCIKIENFVMVRKKQEVVGRMKNFFVHTSNQFNVTGQHKIPSVTNTAKKIIETYNLRDSILIFQLVLIDEYNVAYLTDCQCQTEVIREYEATEFPKIKSTLEALGVRIRRAPTVKRNTLRTANSKRRNHVAANLHVKR